MPNRDDEPTYVSPQLGLLLVEEGFAIETDHGVFQRNPGIDYFNYRKWRKTEDYAIHTQHRDKIYCVSATEPFACTKTQLLEMLGTTKVLVIPPYGRKYKVSQIRRIYSDMTRIHKTILGFVEN